MICLSKIALEEMIRILDESSELIVAVKEIQRTLTYILDETIANKARIEVLERKSLTYIKNYVKELKKLLRDLENNVQSLIEQVDGIHRKILKEILRVGKAIESFE